MTQQKRFLVIVLLGLLTAVVPFSIDMYLPGFPSIAASFGTTVTQVSLSLSSFFVGIGVGQLVYGPLLDRYGRKKPLYAGLLLYCLASVACVYARSIEELIALRFVQALGACAANIAAIAMVRDFFPPKENAKVFSFLILVLSVSPMLAPTTGGYLTTAFGWTSIFIVLTGLTVLIWIGVLFFLPESKGADKTYSLHISAIARGYAAVFKVPYFRTYAILSSMALASLFTYIASSPGVFMEHFGLSQKQYGLLFAFLASGLIVASQVNTFLLRRFSSEGIMRTALFVQVLFGGALFFASLLEVDQFITIACLLFGYLATTGLVMPNATALAMKPFDQNAGSASALLGFIQMGLGSLTTILIGLFNIHTVFLMAVGLVGYSLAGLTLHVISARLPRTKVLSLSRR